jgi:hypothetical protein
MTDALARRKAGLLDEYVKATRFGGLPDAILYALINAIGNFDMDATEKMTVGQRLRSRVIDSTPYGVEQQVTEACEDVRRAREV